MPIACRIFGGRGFSKHFILLAAPPADQKRGAMTLADLGKAGVPMLAYGRFIAVAINVMFLAFAIFMMVRQIKRLKAGRAARAAGNAARA